MTGRRTVRQTALWLGCILLLSGCTRGTPPNILILLLDDLGYNDLAFYTELNGVQVEPMHTPAIDHFASQGVHFPRHYTESTCSPSRAALLSGKYPARFGFTSDGRGLPPELTTLADALSASSYHTHFIGKWHTGDTTALAYPENQGFDTWFGFLNQWMLSSDYDPALHNLRPPTYHNPMLQTESGERRQYQGHLTDLLTQNAVDFLSAEERAPDAEPWFMQVSFYGPHEPVQAAQRYRERYPDTPEGAYRAMVHQLDDSIARILQTLEEQGVADNTVVVVASDNGGVAERFPSNLPYAGAKATYNEGGVRAPLMIRAPDHIQPGTIYPHAVSLMDVYPTLLAMAGVDYEEGSLDGRNLLPLLESGERLERPMFWESYGGDEYIYSVLEENHRWRYSTWFQNLNGLFDLEADPTGGNNLLANPTLLGEDAVEQKVEALRARYRQWHRQIHRPEIHFERTGPDGRGILTGDSFQRSPGFGAYTFVINVQMEETADDAAEHIIAHQPDLLAITVTNGRLSARVEDAELSAAIPEDGRCHSVAITAHFHPRVSPIGGTDPIDSTIDLLVDGVKVDTTVQRRLLPKQADMMQPTFIGYSPVEPAGIVFPGTLSEPVIFNRQIAGEASGLSLSDPQCL